ncbi:MAG: FtsQ-type POTRA domain-containing protein [Porticoccaceae bacterium]|jgi:cell division protein FtsQ|nr:FtsQ-type POTRA domain-containing protein [Porticoccaceae bacterium]MDG1308372.1 FtsQ-type POTRA domain-containing protein [Porticoccaceae bacterium]
MATQNRRGANRRQRGMNRPAQRSFSGWLENISRLLIVAMFVVVIYGGKLVYQQIDKPLTQIMIGGDFSYLQQQELMSLVNNQIDGGFLSVDLSNLSQVLDAHPWVDQVSIRRQWPSTLKVEVLEEVPIARWGKEGFLNRLGEELTIADNSKLADLPVLRAKYGTSREMMQEYQSMAELIVPTGLKLVELQRDSLGAWRVDTAVGIRLVLGRDQIAEKIRRFVLVWKSGLNQHLGSIKTIDLRYPNGLAVAWKDGALIDAQDDTKANTAQSAQGRQELLRKNYG